MKSLYESILSSTKTGKSCEAEKVIEWFKNTQNYRMFYMNTNCEVKATPKGEYWIIDVDGDDAKSMNAFIFAKGDTENASGILPYNIYCVRANNKAVNITYQQLKLKDSKYIVQEVSKFVSFYGCEIDKIDKLPKGCTEIEVNYGHALGGGSPTVVKEIKNIKLNRFIQNSVYRGGLACRLNNIKNITVTDEMYICDEMLGYFSLDKGCSKFKPDASEMLTEFFKNNKVDPKICKFLPSDNNSTKAKIGKISFDKKSNIWRFIGDNKIIL